ncbi:MAG: YopX family protein [Nanoarchaeota archaeon]
MLKVRIVLKAKKDWGSIQTDGILIIHNEVFNLDNGIAFYPIDKKQWDIVACDVFSGVITKNNNELYAGDIIRSYDSAGERIEHIIKYDSKEARFACNINHPNHYFRTESGFNQSWVTEFEKEYIGNIYENPELVK